MASSLFDLTGKTAVVVGGTSGIGLAMAVGLAEAGADVVASSRRQEQVDEAATMIEGHGRKALRLTSDVGDRATLQHLLDETVKAWGKVDILINCGREDQACADCRFFLKTCGMTSWTRM